MFMEILLSTRHSAFQVVQHSDCTLRENQPREELRPGLVCLQETLSAIDGSWQGAWSQRPVHQDVLCKGRSICTRAYRKQRLAEGDGEERHSRGQVRHGFGAQMDDPGEPGNLTLSIFFQKPPTAMAEPRAPCCKPTPLGRLFSNFSTVGFPLYYLSVLLSYKSHGLFVSNLWLK